MQITIPKFSKRYYKNHIVLYDSINNIAHVLNTTKDKAAILLAALLQKNISDRTKIGHVKKLNKWNLQQEYEIPYWATKFYYQYVEIPDGQDLIIFRGQIY